MAKRAPEQRRLKVRLCALVLLVALLRACVVLLLAAITPGLCDGFARRVRHRNGRLAGADLVQAISVDRN